MNKGKVITCTLIYLAFFAIGMVVGMTYQQVITQATLMKVADSLSGVKVDIDLNETQIIDGITDFYTPYFEEMINKSENDSLGEQDE